MIRSAEGAQFFVPRRFVLGSLEKMSNVHNIPYTSAMPHSLPDMSDAFQTLIKLCYSDTCDLERGSFDFDSLKPILRMCWKLKQRLPACVQATHVPVLVREPLRVFALATQYGQQELMQQAARACLRCVDALAIDAPELDEIASRPYRRLLLYRRRCAEALGDLPTSYHDIYEAFGRDWAWASCPECLQKVHDDDPMSCWFLGYYDRVLAVLEKTPHPDVLRGETLRVDGVARASQSCTKCASSALADVGRFLELLVPQVERRLSKVKLSDITCVLVALVLTHFASVGLLVGCIRRRFLASLESMQCRLASAHCLTVVV